MTYSCSYLRSRFDNTVSHPTIETSATISGHSQTAWFGSCPYNAASVRLDDTVCYDAIGIAVTVGGGSFSNQSGTDCGVWSESIGNTWLIDHYYSGVKGSSNILAPIYRVRQSSAGTFKFGTSFYTVTASGGLYI
jgi:hypothetical protein